MIPYTYDNIPPDAVFQRGAVILYWMHIIFSIISLGTASFVVLVVSYLYRYSSRGSIYESHFVWMIRSFWKSFLWACILGVLGILIFGVPGFFICLLSLVWFERQMIRGLQRAKANQPMPS